MKRPILIFFFLAVIGFAQETVVVTASRLPEKPTPGIQVYTEEDWQGLSRVWEALERIPGLRLVQTGSPSNTFVTTKGFGESGHTRVRIVVDGIPVNAPDLATPSLGSLPLAEVERIEWSPSAATARWGDASLAGVVHIITRSHSPKPEFSVLLGADHLLGTSAALRFALPAGEHNFFLSAWRNQVLPTRERSDSLSWGASTRWLWITSALETALGFRIDPTEDLLPGSLTPTQFAANPDRSFSPSDRAGRFSWRIDARVGSPDRSELDLTWNSPMALVRREAESDFTAFSSYANTTLNEASWYPVLRWTHVYPNGVRQKLDLGGDLTWSSIFLRRFSTVEREAEVGRADVQRWLLGGFLGVEFEADPASIGFDGRYQQARYSGGGSVTGQDEQTVLGFSGNIGFRDSAQHYLLKVSKVFRMPLLDEKISYHGFGDAFLHDLGPEDGYSFDLEGAWNWESFRADFQVFLLFMRDEIVWDNAVFRNVNSGLTRRLGVRPTLAWHLDPIRLKATYAWTDARTGWDLNALLPFLPLVPAHEASSTFDVVLPLGFQGHTSLSWYGPVFYDAAQTKTLKPRTLWDARIGWSGELVGGRWNVGVSVLNILDDRTPTSAFVGFPDDGFYPSPGRTFRLSVESRW